MRDAFVGSVAWVAPPVSCHTSQLSIVPAARSPGRVPFEKPQLAKQPFELARRKIWVGKQAGAAGNPFRAQCELLCTPGCAAILPHDGSMNWPTGRAFPDDNCLALVRDPERQGGRARPTNGLARRLPHAIEDLHRVVLHPSGLGKILWNLPTGAAGDLAVTPDHEARHTRGAQRRLPERASRRWFSKIIRRPVDIPIRNDRRDQRGRRDVECGVVHRHIGGCHEPADTREPRRPIAVR